MINDGRLPILGNEARSAEHPVAGQRRSKSRGVPFPMHQVRAGNMGEHEPFFVPVDIMKMIAAFPKERAIRVARHGVAGAGMREMKREPIRRRILRPCRRLQFMRLRSLVGLRDKLAGHPIQHQLAILHFGTARDFRNPEAPGAILRLLVVEGPPRPRLYVRFEVGLQRRDLLRRKRPIKNAGIVNRPAEMFHAVLREMAFTDHHRAANTERLWRPNRVLRILHAIAERRDLCAFVNHRHLHKRLRIRSLRRERSLIPFRARKRITSRHPFSRRKLPEDDAIESAAVVINGQCAAAALREVRRSDPDDKRLVFECILPGCMGKWGNRGQQRDHDSFGSVDCVFHDYLY